MAARSRMTKAKMFSYMRNVGKSFGYAMVDSVSTMNPTVTALFKSTAEQSKELYSSVKNFDAKSLGFESGDLKGTLGQAVKDIRNNALDDIRTGKWYNKERINRYNDEMAEDMLGINFDDFGDFDDFNFDDTDLDEQASITQDATRATAEAMDKVGGKVAGAVSTAAIQSADYIVESGRLNTKALYNLNLTGFGQVNKGLAAMNGNLQLLVSLAEPITTHIQNSALFYTQTQEYHTKSLELLKQIVANTSPKAPSGYKGGSRSKGYMDYITSDGIIDFQALLTDGGKRIKENTELITSMLSMVPGGEKAIIKMASASPLQFALTTAIGSLFNVKGKNGKSIRDSFEDFNKVLSNFSVGLLGKAKNATFGDNFFSPFLRGIRDFLLPDNRVIKKPDPGKYEKGKVDWDGMSRKALMDVIPTQLSQILSALTGEPERRFDYNTGRWVKVSNIRSNREASMRNITNSAGGELFKTISKSIDRSSMSSKAKKNYKQQLETFLEKAVMSGDDDFLEFLTEGFDFSKFGMSANVGRDLQKRIKYIGNSGNGQRQLSEFAGNVYKARSSVNRRNESVQGAESALYDGSLRRPGGRLIDLKDEYGFSQNDYLRKILEHVSYISKNLKNLVGIPGVGGFSQNGTVINWEEGDKITRSSDRVSDAKSSSDRIDPELRNDYDMRKSVDAAMSRSEGPGYSSKEEEYIRKRKANPNYPIDKDLEDSIARKDNLYEMSQKGKSFASNAYNKLKGNSSGNSLLDKIEKELGLATDNVTAALDEMSAGLNKFIYDKDFGLYHLMNTMTMGVLDMMKEMIPRPLREGISKLWGSFKESNFGKETFGTLKNIGLSFFGKKKKAPVYGTAMDAYKDQMMDIEGYDPDMFRAKGARRVNKTGMVVVSKGEMIIPSDINPFYKKITNRYDQMKAEQKAHANFWGNFARGTFSAGESGIESEIIKEAVGQSSGRESKSKSSNKDDGVGETEDVPPEQAKGAIKSVLSAAGKYLGDKLFNTVSKVMGKTEDDQGKIKSKLDKMVKEAGLGKGAIGAGALIGGGVSLLTGAFLGPIAGAAIGAAAGFVSKSETAQKFLFGDFEVDENGNKTDTRTGGLLNKEISNFFQKNAGGTAKGAGVGLAVGTFMGSPVLGAVLGATAGFVSTSESAKKFIFGDEKEGEEGIIPLGLQKVLKERFPFLATGVGAALLLAPGPLIPKLAIGATLGFIAGEDGGKGLKQWFFGDGKDDKGFLGFMNERLFQPILGTIDKAFNMLTKGLKDRLTTLVRGFGNFLKDRLKESTVGRGVLDLGNKLRSAGDTVLHGAVDIVGSPFRAANTALEKAALRNGTSFRGADNKFLSSSERLKLAAEKGYKYRETGSTLVDQYLKDLDPEEYDQFIADMQAAEKGDEAGNARLESILMNAKHTSKLKYGDITHAIQQAKIDRDKWKSDRQAEEERKKTPEYNVTERIPSLIESVLTVATDIRNKIVGKDVFTSGLTEDYNAASNEHSKVKQILDSNYDKELAMMVGSGVEGNTDSLNRDLVLEEQDPNASNELRQQTKNRNTILGGVASITGITPAVAKTTEAINSLGDKLLGEDKKESLFDKIKNAIIGEDGLLGGILGFFTGGTGIGGLVGKLLGKFSLKSAIMSGLGIGALIAGFSGALNPLFEKLGELPIFNGNDNGSAFDNDESSVLPEDATQIGHEEDELTPYVPTKPGTPNTYKDKNGNTVRVGSNNSADKRLWKNTLSGLALGRSSVASTAIKKVTGIDITTKGITGSLTKIASGNVEGICQTIATLCSKLAGFLAKVPFLKKILGGQEKEKFAATMANKINQYVRKKATSTAIQKTAALMKNVLIAVKWVYVGVRVVDAWGNAESILGITDEATTGQRFIACCIAFFNAVCPIIGDLIPDNVLVNIFMELAKAAGLEFVSDLQAQRDKAEKELEEYIAQTGDTSMTIEKYNQLGYTYDEETGTFVQGDSKAGVFTKAKMWVGGKIDDFKANRAGKSSLTGYERYVGGGGASGVVTQFDPRFKNLTVGGKSFAANGCGPASAVMAAGGNLKDAVRIAQRYQTTGGTDAAYFGEMFNRKGMSAHYYLAGGSSLIGDIASGKPTVLMGRDATNTSKDYSPFGPNNHYVVASGFDGAGNLLISDPEQTGIRAYSPNILRNVKVGISGGATDPSGYNAAMVYANSNNTAYNAGALGAITPSTKSTTSNVSSDLGTTSARQEQRDINTTAATNGKQDPGGTMSQIWGYLGSKGLNEYARAGLMGCWASESNLNPDTLEGNYKLKENANDVMGSSSSSDAYAQRLFDLYARNGISINKSAYMGEDGHYYPGYGLAQWTGPRQYKLMQFAKGNNVDHRTLGGQLDYFWSEYGNRPKLQSSLESANSVEAGTIAALDHYEMSDGWHNSSKGQKQLSERLAHANDIYSKMTGLPGTMPDGSSYVDGDIGDMSDENADEQATKKKDSKATLGGILSTITSAFSSALSKIFFGGGDDESTLSTAKNGAEAGAAIGASVLSDNDPVGYMESMRDKITYTYGASDPEGGKSDCSGTVNWAVRKASGIDIGRDTLTMYNSKNLKPIWYNNGNSIGTIPAGAKRNDILLFSRPNSDYTIGRPDRVGHVGIYTGEGNKFIEIGKGTGTYISNLSSGSNLIKVSRLIDDNGNEVEFNTGLDEANTTEGGNENQIQALDNSLENTNKNAYNFSKNYMSMSLDKSLAGKGSGLLHYGPSKAGNYILKDSSRNYYRTNKGAGASNITNAVSGASLISAAKNTIFNAASSAKNVNKKAIDTSANVSAIKSDTSEMNQNIKVIADAVKVIGEALASNRSKPTTSEVPNGGTDEAMLKAIQELTDITASINTI